MFLKRRQYSVIDKSPQQKSQNLVLRWRALSLLIPKELILERKPNVTRGGILRQDELRQVSGDVVGDPRLDDAIHAAPIWEVGRLMS
jgi:hypothetical protein